MCAHARKARPHAAVPAILGDQIKFGCIFEGKKFTKGFCTVAKLQHCASPFLQLRYGPRVKEKIRAALIAC